jgi:hypothetical protein
MGVGWLVANFTIGEHDLAWFGVFVATWLITGLILQRSEFKAAPSSIRFIDP